MKKIIYFAASLIFIGCAIEKNTLTQDELLHWSNRNDTLFYNGRPSAVFTGFELELYKGEMTQEICIEQIDDETPLDSIVYYVHTLHRNDKVQVISTYARDKLKIKR